ncbi:MAG: acyl carrier protein [Proteobacteria bacterium]|nr:acyl carrier protein [Pseudomonadota bacterium]
MSLFERVQETVAATLKVPPEKITRELRDEDLAAWDSLGHVNLVMALEQTFGVYIEVEDFANLNSIPGIMGFLEKQGVS